MLNVGLLIPVSQEDQHWATQVLRKKTVQRLIAVSTFITVPQNQIAVGAKGNRRRLVYFCGGCCVPCQGRLTILAFKAAFPSGVSAKGTGRKGGGSPLSQDPRRWLMLGCPNQQLGETFFFNLRLVAWTGKGNESRKHGERRAEGEERAPPMGPR